MVRELVTINIGQAGIQLSQSVWQQYCAEHEISNDGELRTTAITLQKGSYYNPPKPRHRRSASITEIMEENGHLHAFFDESDKGTYVPRNISVDTEPNVIDDIKTSNLSKLFYNEDLLSGNEDAANNFARGKYTIGRDIIDRVTERLRKKIEKCENVEGFILNHAVGGGTGSGLGDLVIERIHKYKKTTLGFEIYPSPTISTCVVEPYNSVLSTGGALSESTDNIISFVMDNEKLYKICNKQLDIKKPSYGNINRLISKAISSLTASIRFEGELNLDVSDLATNLIPFPSLHFMLTSMAPILTPEKMKTFECDARSLTDACFNESNFYVNIPDFNKEDDKYLAAMVMYRGNIQASEANAATQWLVKHSKCNFVDWIPCKFKLCLNNKKVALVDHRQNNDDDGNEDLGESSSTGLMVSNNVGIGRVFSNTICKKFDIMYSQRAFVHWFVGEGLEECEFDEAREELGILEQDYLDAMNELSSSSSDSEEEEDGDDEDF